MTLRNLFFSKRMTISPGTVSSALIAKSPQVIGAMILMSRPNLPARHSPWVLERDHKQVNKVASPLYIIQSAMCFSNTTRPCIMPSTLQELFFSFSKSETQPTISTCHGVISVSSPAVILAWEMVPITLNNAALICPGKASGLMMAKVTCREQA